MFKTVEEGLGVFKGKLEHRLYMDQVIQEIGKTPSNPVSDAQWQRLEGMKMALGLSGDEVRKIMTDIKEGG